MAKPTKSDLQNELAADSLMEEIQKIIKPPDEENSGKKKSTVASISGYRKGCSRNQDFCHSCGETGALICCHECPASFHYSCHDPPLQVEVRDIFHQIHMFCNKFSL